VLKSPTAGWDFLCLRIFQTIDGDGDGDDDDDDDDNKFYIRQNAVAEKGKQEGCQKGQCQELHYAHTGSEKTPGLSS